MFKFIKQYKVVTTFIVPAFGTCKVEKEYFPSEDEALSFCETINDKSIGKDCELTPDFSWKAIYKGSSKKLVFNF